MRRPLTFLTALLPQRHLLLAVVLASAQGAGGQQVAPYFSGDVIAVDARINQQVSRWFFDTGASATALFANGAARLQIESEPTEPFTVAGKRVEARRAKEFAFEMFGQQTRAKLLILPWAHAYDGVLSWRDVPGAMLIDGGERRIHAVSKPPSPDGWQRWNIEPGNSQLFISVTKDGRPLGRVFVDTGVSGGLRLAPKLWAAWVQKNAGKSRTIERFQYSVGEPMVNELAWADEYQLGDLAFHRIDIGPIPTAKGDVAHDKDGKEFIATIGTRALRHMRVIISPVTNELLTQSIPDHPAHNRLGAVFLPGKERSGALVCRVAPDSPATEAGLRDGDLFLSVNGEKPDADSEIQSRRLDAIFSEKPGTPITLRVQRDGKEVAIHATLRNLLR